MKHDPHRTGWLLAIRTIICVPTLGFPTYDSLFVKLEIPHSEIELIGLARSFPNHEEIAKKFDRNTTIDISVE